MFLSSNSTILLEFHRDKLLHHHHYRYRHRHRHPWNYQHGRSTRLTRSWTPACVVLGIVLEARRFSTKDRMRISTKKGKSVWESWERERVKRKREWWLQELYYMKKDTRTSTRLKTGVEPNWFGIMPCASVCSVVRSTPKFLECSRIIWNVHEFSILK